MEKKAVELLGLVFRLLLRYWARDSKVLSQNVVDVVQFAQQCGLSVWDAKKFNRSIEDFIDLMAENFLNEIGNEIQDEERKKAILNQIQNDIKKININEKNIILELSNSEDLRNAIMIQSQEERKTWEDVEVGIYTNCIRYISKAGIDFVSKLPSYTPEALKIVIQRQKEYHDELFAILTDIHSMTKLIKSVDVTFREYESTYREKLIEKYSKVEIIGAGLKDRNIRRYDISLAYVELNCIDDEFDEEINLSKVFSYSKVVWVKGEAGSGKTTFLQWVAVCAAKNDYQQIENIRGAVPIVIGLRNIDWPISLNDIVNKITVQYGSNCPDGWVLELLNKRRAILLFDGLDEISQNKRDETYNFIENIVETYPEIKVLLTARNSVSDQIDCNSASYEIVPMKIGNIKRFIKYWHRSVLRRDALINDEEINKLQKNLILKIVEIQALKSLARNPLLCAMICALNYVNSEQLPNEKMELYDKCCEMLMDTRDTQREIDSSIYENIPKLDYSRKRKVLEEIAYWMMNGGISSESKNNVKDYLKHLSKDTKIFPDTKEYSIEKLLDFFIERSGIIREPEEGVIDFIHKTFMEFLAVKAICRNCAWNVLVKEACNVNWRETILMCFREMGKSNVESVLTQLVDLGKKKGDSRYILMASLGISNAVFLANNEIKKEIDKQISLMIPPSSSDIYEMSQAGTYLLPFLKDLPQYSNIEKEECLNLLDYLDTEEVIPDVLSYISGNGNYDVKKYAIDILSEYTESVLDEYNVREQLLEIIKISINEKSLTIYENMLYILSTFKLTPKDIEKFEKVESLTLICGITEESLYTEGNGIFEKLKKCKKVTLIGNIQRLDFLVSFSTIIELIIDAFDISKSIQKFSTFNNLVTVKKLIIKTVYLNYICNSDLNSMKNIESFELHCYDKRMELNFNNFSNFNNLKNVVIDVHAFLADEIRMQISTWESKNSDLKVHLYNIDYKE